MNYFWERAHELMPEMQANRRHMHENPEVGMNVPNTARFVKEKLEEMGVEATLVGEEGIGVIGLIRGGKTGKTIMLRAELDALPMCEENDLPFRSTTNQAHMCGHDMHAAMLLGAAKMLVEKREELCGNVKLMFQPAEEIFEGSMFMIEHGALENPTVDAALGMHVMLSEGPGSVFGGEGFMTSSCDGFAITITGKGCHGAMPQTGIDPINVGVHIYQAFMELMSREKGPMDIAVLTLGQFNAGSTPNIVPETCVLKGTLRTYDETLRTKLVARMKEIATLTAETFGAKAEYEVLSAVPATYTNPEMLTKVMGYIKEMDAGIQTHTGEKITPSDDFANVAAKVPTTYLMLNAKVDGNPYGHHNPGVVFNEDAMPIGASVHAQSAFCWLKENA